MKNDNLERGQLAIEIKDGNVVLTTKTTTMEISVANWLMINSKLNALLQASRGAHLD